MQRSVLGEIRIWRDASFHLFLLAPQHCGAERPRPGDRWRLQCRTVSTHVPSTAKRRRTEPPMPRLVAVAIATRPFSDIGRCRAVPVSRKMLWESGDFLAEVREHR